MSERKAFDLTRYLEGGNFNQKAFINDLSSLSIEAADNRLLHERINPFILETRPDGRVVNPETDERDVSEHYSEVTEKDRKEKEAGLKIKESLLKEPVGTVSVWISPPGGELNYEEGRIIVGVSKIQDKLKLLESYGIATPFAPEQSLFIAWRLAEFSDKNYSHLREPEDLRSEVITFMSPRDSSPWDLLRELIPMNKVWDAIESKEVKRIKEEAFKDAEDVYLKVSPMIDRARLEDDYVRAGAHAERLMGQKGRPIASGPCGLLNSDLLSSATSYFYTRVDINSYGKPTVVAAEKGKFVKSCGRCGRPINSVIRAGYKCSCGGVYEGC